MKYAKQYLFRKSLYSFISLSAFVSAIGHLNASEWLPDPIKDFSGVVVPAVSIESLPYKGVDTQVNPSLVIMGRLNKFFIEGNRAGYLINRSSIGALSLIGQLRNHQYIPSGDQLAEREKAVELGFQLAKPLTNGWSAQLTAFTDISDTHKGQELEIGFYRRDFFGDFRLVTLLALQQQSSSLTGYYADSPSYSAGGDLNGELELIGVYDITDNINFTFVYRHYVHGEEFSNSPITEGRKTQKLILGVGWTF